MKALYPIKLLQSNFYLGGIVVGLTIIHLILSWRVTGDINRQTLNVLFWGAILSLLWRKRYTLNLESGIFSSFVGSILITLVLFKSISLFWFESSFLKFAPLLLSLGFGLLASGVKGLKQYWREFAIVLLLCLPDGDFLTAPVQELFKVTILTAKFAVFMLWYLGFEVSGHGANIFMPQGSVWVDTPCTGISTAFFLLKLALVFILTFSTNWWKKALVLLGAVGIAFVSGGIRVAIMAVVVSDRQAFDYWHNEPGNQIFSTIAIFLFGLLCHFLLPSSDASTSPKSGELQQL